MSKVKTKSQCFLVEEGQGAEGGEGEVEATGEGDLQGRADNFKFICSISFVTFICHNPANLLILTSVRA